MDSKDNEISVIKKDIIETVEKVEEIIKEDTVNCYTRIAVFFKKLVYCECNSSSNCIKK
jgi:hypothetical protein